MDVTEDADTSDPFSIIRSYNQQKYTFSMNMGAISPNNIVNRNVVEIAKHLSDNQCNLLDQDVLAADYSAC